MPLVIRDVIPQDLPAVLALNESELPHVGKIDMAQVLWFAAHADYFRVARKDEHLAGFLIGLRPGSSYTSLNYRWFCERYVDFAYVDRIVVARHARGQGLGARLYDDFAESMPASISLITCEVNTIPPNEQSMGFHMNLGFTRVGTLSTEAGQKEVALLLKRF
ncbi:MAG: GNAT family N-acetyltransferase [Gammaproteobacteria bacterium]|nr:GNAT family N-acetyltransferase [Gammaproteobacteria bacterium]MDH5302999.1 GNAT family N-acetyltransferase [Gammaproteobacteria bacterium]MDH5321254.1 GNAT family N-acetyltransferase [Gammaproteobacteria bacterium]